MLCIYSFGTVKILFAGQKLKIVRNANKFAWIEEILCTTGIYELPGLHKQILVEQPVPGLALIWSGWKGSISWTAPP